MQPPNEVLPEVLTYQPDDRQKFDGHVRSALLRTVEEAARIQPPWGLDLADAMVGLRVWDSDLWRHVLIAWAAADLDHDGVKRVLSHLSAVELHGQHPREIADVLSQLARQIAEVDATGLLDEANAIAMALRPYTAADDLPQFTVSSGGAPQYVSWLQRAINHASGRLALFWLQSIVLWRRRQEPTPQSLSAEYREALDAIIAEDDVLGKFGRTVLASNFHFLLTVDEGWTTNSLLPLFGTEHEDFRCAWDGFLSWGRLSPYIAELLRDKFRTAVPCVAQEFQGEMLRRFVEFYTVAMSLLINDANDGWIADLFQHADAEMRGQFALEIGHCLRDLDENRQQEWWNVWLRDYWENRLQGVPSPLGDSEIDHMLEWVIHLPGVFPEAVSMATRMRTIALGRSVTLHCIAESGLIETYPKELARLLAHFGQCDTGQWFWHGTRTTVDRLLEKGLPPDLEKGMRELIVRHGLS